MDISKFKIRYFLIVGFILLTPSFVSAQQQYDVPVYITSSQPIDTTQQIIIRPNANVDFPYIKQDTAYRFAYGGYNNIIVDQRVFPVHMEEFDDFNIAYFKSDSTVNLIYSGAQGAVKNDFLFQRYTAFEEYGKKLSLIDTSKEELEKSIDSLTNVWVEEAKFYNLSELFKRDEKMFYKSFKDFALLAHKVIEEGKSGLEDLALSDFPKQNYNNPRYYTTIPLYREIANAYHLQHILEEPSVSQAKNYINDLSNFSVIEYLKNKTFELSTEHHPRADDLYRIAKPLYLPHLPANRRLHRKSKRNRSGKTFTAPDGYTIDNKTADFDQLKGKEIYLFTYLISDINLKSNLKVWNKFVVENKNENRYFVAMAVDGQLYPDAWKSLQFNSQIAGWNISNDYKKAKEYQADMGILLLPRVMSVGPDGKIIDPNLKLDFTKSR